MAYQQLTCCICHQEIVNPSLDTVEYICGHMEHANCYHHRHPANRICIVCHTVSWLLFFC